VYSDAKLGAGVYGQGGTVKLSFSVKNGGQRDGDEVAQVYFRRENSGPTEARLSLCGFTRVHVTRGQTTRVSVEIPAARLRYWDTAQKRYVVQSGRYELLIGGASDDIRRRVPVKISAAA